MTPVTPAGSAFGPGDRTVAEDYPAALVAAAEPGRVHPPRQPPDVAVPWELFYRLLQQAVELPPVYWRDVADAERGHDHNP